MKNFEIKELDKSNISITFPKIPEPSKEFIVEIKNTNIVFGDNLL